MRIGILGTRGIPNAYGGFEQFAEHFSSHMVRRGHQVWVYCSSLHPYQTSTWNGVQLIHCPDPEDRMGSFGQFIYDYRCMKDARRRSFDILLILGYTSSSVWMRMAPAASISITNMDGLEWKRSKYPPAVRRFLKKAESWAAKRSDYLIADSPAIAEYLQNNYGRNAKYVAYGATPYEHPEPNYLREFGVEPGKYSMLVARSEPENHIHTICEAYAHSSAKDPLLVIGNFDNRYGKGLKKYFSDDRIRFIGPVYELEKLNPLRHYSRLYFHGHSVGGTNPSLLEAMASSALICAHDNVFNRAVLGENAFYFSSMTDLQEQINKQPKKQDYKHFLSANLTKIRDHYSWPRISNELEDFFESCLQP